MESESKIVFLDGGVERVLRGRIVAEDDNFLELARRDGTVRIAMSTICRIDNRRILTRND